jgi:uncharacterized surface protein with fasciclin (FAS1) repeats
MTTIIKNMRRLGATLLCGLLLAGGVLTSCSDDPTGDSYYTFTGEMVSDYLQNRDDQFSEFIEVLQRAQLWDLMATYGEFTCFAPTNDAMDIYLAGRGVHSVADLPTAECDTLAWTHIVKSTYFTTDLSEGSLPSTNMNGRYLTLSCDTDATNNGNIIYKINSTAELIARDDSVENGVVHTINRVISASNIFLPEVMAGDSTISLFAAALEVTGLADSLVNYLDENYSVGIDSTVVVSGMHHRTFGNNDVYWKYPEQRKFLYTIFVEPDSIYHAAGIRTIEDLAAYAKSVYDVTYPKDAGKYDDDYTNRRNPLNRFVAYHIIDRYASYSDLTVTDQPFDTKKYFRTDCQDVMEFYETLCPYTILQVCDAAGNKWVNRRGVGVRYKVRGSRIYAPSEISGHTEALNGVYHYIDEILTYNQSKTIDQVLNIRMRIDATTLSPDFMNAGARNIDASGYNVSYLMTGFKPGFTKNFIFKGDTFFGVHNRFWCNSYENDMCACLDNFDIKFRIPPVPAGQTYEVRLGYTCGANRTVVQIYFDDNLTGDIPTGIPVDLRNYGNVYGWQSDADLGNIEEDIEANDKALRNQGFMKGAAGYTFADGSSLPRDAIQCLRRILVTQYLEEEHDYYIRLRQVLDNNAEMSLDYIELCPKSVYDGTTAEDRY